MQKLLHQEYHSNPSFCQDYKTRTQHPEKESIVRSSDHAQLAQQRMDELGNGRLHIDVMAYEFIAATKLRSGADCHKKWGVVALNRKWLRVSPRRVSKWTTSPMAVMGPWRKARKSELEAQRKITCVRIHLQLAPC